MKKKFVIASLIVVTAAAVWGVMKYRSQTGNVASTAIWVQAEKVSQSNLPLEAQAIGTLVARSVEITPEVAGHVKVIHFRDGAHVAQNTPLVQLDDEVYKAKYESTKAQLAYSKNDYKRKNLLIKQGAITQQAVDQADADLKEKTANAQEHAVMLSKMQLTAPFDGVVGKSKINLGDYVTTGQGLVTLTDTKHLRIEYNVPEIYLPSLKAGQEVQLTTSTYPGKIFTGKVSFISPTVSTENRSVSLYADVPNENNELAAGMFVNVKQSLGIEEKVIMVPARSLVPVLDGEQVFKITDGKAYSVPVTTGKRMNDKVQITQGLSSGDLIITDGQLKVKNGAPVQVKG